MARAVYADADIVLLDDCLSAVDAHTGKALLERCLLDALAKKTRILVTHALHVLDKTDYIYVMDEGKIVEQGTYTDLRSNSVVFSRLMDEYGNLDQEGEEEKEAEREEEAVKGKTDAPEDAGEKKAQAALMQAEERSTGAVSLDTYLKYFKYAGTILWAPTIIILLLASQGASSACMLGFLVILPSNTFAFLSWKQFVPRLLDGTEHSWLQSRRLHGCIRRPRCRTGGILILRRFLVQVSRPHSGIQQCADSNLLAWSRWRLVFGCSGKLSKECSTLLSHSLTRRRWVRETF